MADTYAIRTVEDFLAIPHDRLEDCLRDFEAAVILARSTRAAVLAMVEQDGRDLGGSPVTLAVFEWTDDGERVAKMRFIEASGGGG